MCSLQKGARITEQSSQLRRFIACLYLQVRRLGLDCLHVFGELAEDVVVFKMAEDKSFLVRRGA
jgi:hypothetical protein